MSYHEIRLPFDPRREVLWATLCRHYFQRLVPPDATVLELGAGYGHFINNIRAARRIAVDTWPGMADYVRPPVEARIASATDLSWIPGQPVDFTFASNLFEHLAREDFLTVLAQVRSKLSPHGSLNILQPNFRYAYKEYFDDFTHISVYSAAGMCDLLAANGWKVLECRPRFLPLTVKSQFPVSPLMIRLYLTLPVKPFGKQMFIRAAPDGSTLR